jgi:nucleoside phosphorylase
VNQRHLNLVAALPAEARPLISHFGLTRQQPDGAFPLYRKGPISLVLSGVGKDAAAAATSFLRQATPHHRDTLWLNLGIAGHASRPIGEAILAREITDEETGQRWEPAIHFTPPCATDRLTTLAQPEFNYRRPGAFDMEAAGFYGAAMQLAPQTDILCFKVISDNGEQPGQGLSSRRVSQLIGEQLATLSRLLELLQATSPTRSEAHLSC